MTENFHIDLDDYDQGSSGANPFGNDLTGEPYADEFRKLSLNKLLHLAPYSEVLLVSGAKDIGKSTLLQQFASRAGESWRVAFIKATPVMTARALLLQIAQDLSLSFNDTDSQDDLQWEIIRYLQALGRSGRRAILVIDDAHLLLAEVLSRVEDILEDERSLNAMSVILAVDSNHESRLRSFPVLQDRLAYTLKFEPLSQDGVNEYIHHRLLQVDDMKAAEYFSPPIVEQIFEQSRGLPGQVNALARMRLVAASAEQKSNGRRSVIRWVLAVAGIAILTVALVLQDEINRMVGMPLELDESDLVSSGEGGGDVIASAEQAGSNSAVDRGATEPVDGPAGLELPPRAALITAEGTSAESDGLSPTVVSAGEPELPAPKKPGPGNAVTTPNIETVSPAKAPEPSRQEVKAQPESWLMTQSPNNFTLQLMALQNAEKVKRFIEQHGLSEESAMFNINRKGKTLTVLVYGSYGSRAAAEKAAQKLPKTWGLSDPWIRSFESVHQELAAR